MDIQQLQTYSTLIPLCKEFQTKTISLVQFPTMDSLLCLSKELLENKWNLVTSTEIIVKTPRESSGRDGSHIFKSIEE